MNRQLTAIIEREGDVYVALCPEVDVQVRETLLRRREIICKRRQNCFLKRHRLRKSKKDFTMRFMLLIWRQRLGKLLSLSGKDVCHILAKHGFIEVRRRGSHIVVQKKQSGSTITVPVPDHKEIKAGTLLSIIRQSGLLRSEFEQYGYVQ